MNPFQVAIGEKLRPHQTGRALLGWTRFGRAGRPVPRRLAGRRGHRFAQRGLSGGQEGRRVVRRPRPADGAAGPGRTPSGVPPTPMEFRPSNILLVLCVDRIHHGLANCHFD